MQRATGSVAFYNFSLEVLPYYSVLFVLRVLVWAATIYIFWRNATLRHDKVWHTRWVAHSCQAFWISLRPYLLCLFRARFFFADAL